MVDVVDVVLVIVAVVVDVVVVVVVVVVVNDRDTLILLDSTPTQYSWYSLSTEYLKNS